MTEYTDVEIDHIAVEVGGEYDPQTRQWLRAAQEGHFLQLVCTAWQIADVNNKPLMREFMVSMINKYELDKYLNYVYGVDKGKRMVEDQL